MQKRRIKRQYAKAAREAQRAGKVGGKLMTKLAIKAKILAGKMVAKAAAALANPKVLAIIGIAALIIILIMGLISACSSMATGIGQSMAAMSYLAEDECIDDAALYYSELEVNMRLEILNVEESHPGYDEYRFDIGAIGHCPLMLMAYLTAVYHDFTFADIQSVLNEIFAEQYNLQFVSEVEIRTRMETRTGTSSWTDEDGNTHSESYTYEVEVEYEWWILNVILTSQSFFDVINARMNDEQREHYNLLMMSRGLGSTLEKLAVRHVLDEMDGRAKELLRA